MTGEVRTRCCWRHTCSTEAGGACWCDIINATRCDLVQRDAMCCVVSCVMRASLNGARSLSVGVCFAILILLCLVHAEKTDVARKSLPHSARGLRERRLPKWRPTRGADTAKPRLLLYSSKPEIPTCVKRVARYTETLNAVYLKRLGLIGM